MTDHCTRNDPLRGAALMVGPSYGKSPSSAPSLVALSFSRATPAAETVRALAEENEFLKSELLAVKAELAKFEDLKCSTAPNSPRRKAPMMSTRRSPTIVLSTPLFYRKASTSSGCGTNPLPSRKCNRHPSSDDDSLGELIGDKRKLIDSDVEKHESARGLKYRKHASPVHQHRLQSPCDQKVLLKSLNSIYVATPDGSAGLCHDIEASSKMKEGRASPATSETDMTERLYETSLELELFECDLKPSFYSVIQDRAGWLVGLLVLQSMSSFIIGRNEQLLKKHLVIVRFLTMLVGAGGNAGNQASVGVIRDLATGTVNDQNVRETLMRELQMGLGLSFVLGIAGAARAAIFMTPFIETLAITACLVTIVFISVLLGAVLPLIMRQCQIDPVHSSTTIQVLMDILGVMITVRKYCFGDVYRNVTVILLTIDTAVQN